MCSLLRFDQYRTLLALQRESHLFSYHYLYSITELYAIDSITVNWPRADVSPSFVAIYV